ncbi:MAG: N-acetylmuramoyl-L-alanine amidase [Holophagales bacterium]|jgi:N-acetylmuramoyl-L-alanine amidase|nr:N-acetylmuramoyl-L-alanine amidase [Holophagales bacterium]
MEILKSLAVILIPAAIVTAAVEPDLAEVRGRLPNGKFALVRLQFKKGVVVDSKELPKTFATKKGSLPQWLPYEDLTTEGKRWTLKALFPKDEWNKDGIKHSVRWPKLESVWLLSTLFTGYGQHYDKLMDANPNKPELFKEGDIWLIPKILLSPEFGGAAKAPDRSQPEDELSDEARTAAFRAMLSYEKDSKGDYAAYKLRKSETLYYSVVMRYTDLVDAKEVNQLANIIAKRSDIDDVRSIQPGQLIKIPLEYLTDPFMPEGSKGLAEERQMRAEVRRTAKIEAGPRLSGVRIVLDPGHGGIDSGARANGVWESDFVYDITMRVRRLLEFNTEAQVSTTLRYEGIGFGIRNSIPSMTKNAVLLTTPPKPNDGESAISTSVNLRWVLANHFFTRPKAADSRKTIFISFHADSLHPSSRGSMVYVPASNLVPSKFTWSGDGTHVSELRYGASVSFTARQKLESEARSHIFAEGLLKILDQEGLPIHANRPIRNAINRSGKSFIPAVIRTNMAMTKVLIEVVNLQNEEDAVLLKAPDFRERYAEAVVKAIRTHFKNA